MTRRRAFGILVLVLLVVLVGIGVFWTSAPKPANTPMVSKRAPVTTPKPQAMPPQLSEPKRGTAHLVRPDAQLPTDLQMIERFGTLAPKEQQTFYQNVLVATARIVDACSDDGEPMPLVALGRLDQQGLVDVRFATSKQLENGQMPVPLDDKAAEELVQCVDEFLWDLTWPAVEEGQMAPFYLTFELGEGAEAHPTVLHLDAKMYQATQGTDAFKP